LGERVEHELEDQDDHRDPAVIARVLDVLDVTLRWFDPRVEGFERVPDTGPFLVVGNHSGGIYMPDYWALLRHWCRTRGVEAPLYSLGFDFTFSMPGVGWLARKLGSVPANHANAERLLRRGDPVIVYPGGDIEDYRPWSARNRIELGNHRGFVRLALRLGVPVVPMVSHGSHDVIIVLTRGDRLARALGLDRLRINVLPLVAGPPWGIAPVQLPTWPLPARVTVRLGEPVDWSHLPPEAADDPEVVQRCYDEFVDRMQTELDDLAGHLPHPVLARVGTALGLDRLSR
jgi:1-acyl-sn-glycerol-3-phosphate acyltransferase